MAAALRSARNRQSQGQAREGFWLPLPFIGRARRAPPWLLFTVEPWPVLQSAPGQQQAAPICHEIGGSSPLALLAAAKPSIPGRNTFAQGKNLVMLGRFRSRRRGNPGFALPEPPLLHGPQPLQKG